MSIRGIAAGPDQIADREDPTQLAAVSEEGAVKVDAGGTDQGGTSRNPRVDSDGRLILSADEILRELLIEMRLLTALFAESHFIHDIEFRRADIDKDLGL